MVERPTVIDLVDDLEYTRTNCFAHQLHSALHDVEPAILTVPLSLIGTIKRPCAVVCRLRLRTVHRNLALLRGWLGDAPIVLFDQDPWEAYRDGSPYKGTYQSAACELNLKMIAVTTEVWADRLTHDNLPGKFVRMWVEPRYCMRGLRYVDRTIPLGFIGAMHSYRRELFDALGGMGLNVSVRSGGAPYAQYLQQLNDIQIHVHREEAPVIINGDPGMDLKDALWIKDVEAAARGCFSVRNAGVGYMSYMHGMPRDANGNRLVCLYQHADDVPAIIESIQKMDAQTRQDLIDRTVEYIREANVWHETARTLVSSVASFVDGGESHGVSFVE